MPSTPTRSDAVIHTGADPGRCCPSHALETAAPPAEEVAAPLPIIAEHEVILSTAAATAVTPSLEGELDGEDAATEGEDTAAKRPGAPRKRRRRSWIATLVRLVTPSRNRRPRRRHYPTHLDREFIADARMDREMHRL
ncbi:MAG TPA: hypothetical protein VLZ05_23510 [Mycobacterium sp.]|nr:hypothetical protein [Mycobacterium sp.]HUH71585.1 hypothetical protein [Mycobacterium sp.]